MRGHGFEAWLLNQTEGLYGIQGVRVTVRTEDVERTRQLLIELGLVSGAPER